MSNIVLSTDILNLLGKKPVAFGLPTGLFFCCSSLDAGVTDRYCIDDNGAWVTLHGASRLFSLIV